MGHGLFMWRIFALAIFKYLIWNTKNTIWGDVCMVERLDWLLVHNFKVFDFLMGETYYKIKWSNRTYVYDHHLFYKAGSMVGYLKMQFTKAKLRLKQYLRDKGILGKVFSMDRILYRRMSKKLKGFDWKNP